MEMNFDFRVMTSVELISPQFFVSPQISLAYCFCKKGYTTYKVVEIRQETLQTMRSYLNSVTVVTFRRLKPFFFVHESILIR